jgi:hypothetical protein
MHCCLLLPDDLAPRSIDDATIEHYVDTGWEGRTQWRLLGGLGVCHIQLYHNDISATSIYTFMECQFII